MTDPAETRTNTAFRIPQCESRTFGESFQSPVSSWQSETEQKEFHGNSRETKQQSGGGSLFLRRVVRPPWLPPRGYWLALTLYALAGIGAFSLLARLPIVSGNLKIFLLPGAAPFLIGLSVVLYAATRERKQLLFGLALALSLACSAELLDWIDTGGELTTLALPVMLAAWSFVAAVQKQAWLRRAGFWLGLIVIALGFAGQTSYWVHTMPWIDQLQFPYRPPAGFTATLLLLMTGSSAVALATASATSVLRPHRVVAMAGIAGVAGTCLAWLLMSWQVAAAYDRQASLLLARAETAINHIVEGRIRLMERMAVRLAAADGLPPVKIWMADSVAYLKDVEELDAIELVDDSFHRLLSASRSPVRAGQLRAQLNDPATRGWLRQIGTTKQTQVGRVRFGGEDGVDDLMLAIPVNLATGNTAWLTALFDAERLFSLFGQELDGMGLRIYENDALMYSFNADDVGPLSIFLGQKTIEFGSDRSSFDWTAKVFQPLAPHALADSVYAPIWVILLGLTGTLLLMAYQGKTLAFLRRTATLENRLQQQLVQEAYRQRMLDQSVDMLCTIDGSGKFVQINPACERILGYRPDELRGKSVLEFVVAEDRAATGHEVNSVIDAESTVSFRNRCIHRDGRTVHLRWSAEWAAETQTMHAIAHDVTHLPRSEKYAQDQRQVLAQISHGQALPQILDNLCLMLEEQIPGARCSVMLIDGEGRALTPGAAPHLPGELLARIARTEIAPDSGSCGAAAYLREPVLIDDIRKHPNWASLHDLVATLDLAACWAVPVLSETGEVLGTMAVYHQQPRQPGAGQLNMLSTTAELAGVAIQRSRDLLQLADSEQRFRCLFENNPDPVFSLDINGRFESINRAGVKLTGYGEKELLGESSKLLLNSDRDTPNSSLKAALRGEQQRYVEQIRSKNGRIYELDISFLPIVVNGQLQGVFGVAKDITERHAAQQELQRLNLLLGMAGQSARLGGWSLEADGHLNWAPELTSILEYPPGVVPALEDSLRLLHEEDYPAVASALESVLHDGKSIELNARIQTARQRWLDIRITAQPVRDANGRVIRAVGAVQDITDWKHAQQEAVRLSERLLNTLESITDAFFLIDRNWRLSHVNQEAVRVLDIAREDMVGKVVWDVFPGFSESEIGQRYRIVMDSGVAQHFDSWYAPRQRWYEVHAYPSNDGVAVYFRDITAKKAADDDLRNTMAELQRSNRELQEFAFVASHDLQEPLRKIRTFSERLDSRESMLDEEGRDYLRRMSSAASRMQALIIDLLNYSRVGTKAREFGPVRMDRVVDEALIDLEAAIEESGAEVKVGPLPEVWGDASQLKQVMQNLLSNSIKFRVPDRKPVISVEVSEQSEEGWTLKVADNGIGFDEKYMEKVFAPFQRLHARGTYPGTGIGMAIAKKIMERHGGDISARSRPGEGATFYLRFPVNVKGTNNESIAIGTHSGS